MPRGINWAREQLAGVAFLHALHRFIECNAVLVYQRRIAKALYRIGAVNATPDLIEYIQDAIEGL